MRRTHISYSKPWPVLSRCGMYQLLILLAVMAGGLFASASTMAASHRDGDGIIIAGHARFTVITPTLIRLEFSRDGKFIDDRSYFAWRRNVLPPKFQIRRQNGILIIHTSRMTLRWRGGNNSFTAQNLSIAFRDNDGTWPTWKPGDKQTGNLGGTLRSLDGCCGTEPLPDGVVSRDGWYLFKDHTFLVSNAPDAWMRPRPKSETADWYFFGYGKDNYLTALQDLTTISGRIPIPPCYMLGAWRSRYYNFTADEFKQLVLDYDSHKFPLDVLVMDMGWHTPPHWGSMDWNRKLIPHPKKLLAWLRKQDIRVTLNWHPNEGVGPWYSQYDAFCRAMGDNPAAKKILPFADTNRKFMTTYYKLLMDPLEKEGVAFWWLDGGIHLGWDNALDFNNIGRPSNGHRGASFSRWGGWGDQRYPIWFSGDTTSLWRVLRFEVPFTATAGNVGADYWSHDIGGFRVSIPSAELFTRWVQFGALSPVFRTHGSREFGNYRVPWYYGKQTENAVRRAYDLRSRLFPYIYTLAYQCWTQSLPLVRPLYLAYPSAEAAYMHPEEYQFGPSLLVSPIAHRGLGKAWLGAVDMWFPKGTWWNLLTNQRVNQSGDHPVLATADQIPVFVRGGVPLPMQRVTLRMAEKPADPLVICVYPSRSGKFTLYEDNGQSSAYLHGAYALTPLTYENIGSKGVDVTIGPTIGTYAGQQVSRRIIIRLPVTTRPKNVTVNRAAVLCSTTALPGYEYDPVTATTEIRLPGMTIRKPVMVNVTFRGSQEVQALLPRIMNRLAMIHHALAGAGEIRARWKFQLDALLLHLQTLRSQAAQEFGPVSSSTILAGLNASDTELADIRADIQHYRNQQAQASAFALTNIFIGAAVKLRRAGAGILMHDIPRYYKRFQAVNNVQGYNTGLMLHTLTPAGSGDATLAVNMPALAQRDFVLHANSRSVFIFLPFMAAGEYPLYHFIGTATLQWHAGASDVSVSRSIDVQHQLLTRWNILGPFSIGHAPFQGDAAITHAMLGKMYIGKDGKPIRWQAWPAVVSDRGYANITQHLHSLKWWIDLREVYPEANAAALAVTWIKAPSPITCQISVRHNNAMTLWINQNQIIHSPIARGIIDLSAPPPDIKQIQLRKGWNQVVAQVSQHSGDWGFSVRLALPPGVVCEQAAGPPKAVKPAAYSDQPGSTAMRRQFFKLCALAAAKITKRKLRGPFFVDSYAVRALCAAYDMTGNRTYLNACRIWSRRMVDYQSRMRPTGAYYMNYNRKPGSVTGDWYVADSSSIGMAVVATSVRCHGSARHRLLDSAEQFANLVMKRYVQPSGGVSDGLWPQSNRAWWCSSALFGSLSFVLYANTHDQHYLNAGLRAVNWLNHRNLSKERPFPLSQQGPAMIMYVMESYSSGWPYIEKDRALARPALAKVNWYLHWIVKQQQIPLSKRSWPVNKGWGMKFGGLPFHEFIFSRYIPADQNLAIAGDRAIRQLAAVVFVGRPRFTQLSAFLMMSYAQRLDPGAIYRSGH